MCVLEGMSNDTLRKAASLASTDPDGAYDMVLSADEGDIVDKAKKLLDGIPNGLDLMQDRLRADLAKHGEAHFSIEVPTNHRIYFMGSISNRPGSHGLGVMISNNMWALDAKDMQGIADLFDKLAKAARELEK